MSILRMLLLLMVKGIARLFYRFHVTGLDHATKEDWQAVRIGMLLNHTSLAEPIYAGVLPVQFLWRLAKEGAFPVARETMERPLPRLVIGAMAPQVVSISRQRDATWEMFMQEVGRASLVLIAPEGRMKRPDGLDKHGRPMSVRGGFADIVGTMDDGKILICHSGGLHHVLAPGQRFPRLFRTLTAQFEWIDIADYREQWAGNRKGMIADLEQRRARALV